MPNNCSPGYGPPRPPMGPPPPQGSHGGPYHGGYSTSGGYNPYNRPPPTGYPPFNYGQQNGYPPHPPSYDYQTPPIPESSMVSVLNLKKKASVKTKKTKSIIIIINMMALLLTTLIDYEDFKSQFSSF